jgi:hypothetical protein
MKTHHVIALSISGFLGLAGASVADSETIVLKGRSTWIPVSETSNKLADGRTVTRQVLRGTALNDNPNTPLSNASQDCMFTTVTSADGKSFSSGGYCDGLDADGDVYWAYGSATEKGGKWYYIGGTGTFEGLTGGGTYRLALNWPDGKVMATWDGSAQLK